MVNKDGTNTTLLTKAFKHVEDPEVIGIRWSADSSGFIYFRLTQLIPTTTYSAHIFTLADKQHRLLPESGAPLEHPSALSLDGRHRIYAAGESWNLMDVDAKSARVLTPKIKSERFRDESRVYGRFTWSPTNDKVAYKTADDTIYVQDIATGVEKRLGPGHTFAFSPDGNRIAFNRPDQPAIDLFDFSTGKIRTIIQLPRTSGPGRVADRAIAS